MVGLRDRGRQTGRFNWVHLCLFTRFYRVSKRGEISTMMWEKRDQLLTGEDKSGPCESQITQQVAFLNSLWTGRYETGPSDQGEEKQMTWAPYTVGGE